MICSLAGAASIIMKMLYGPRPVRFELLWLLCSIAREVTRWTRACDERVRRPVSYLHHTMYCSLEPFAGDTAGMASWEVLGGPRRSKEGRKS